MLSIILEYYLSIDTAFELDKLPRAGLFCFCADRKFQWELRHVWLSEAAFETQNGL